MISLSILALILNTIHSKYQVYHSELNWKLIPEVFTGKEKQKTAYACEIIKVQHMLTNHIYDPVEIKTIECNSKPFASQCCNIELTTKKNSAPKKKQKKKTFAVLSFTYYFNRNSFLSVADSARVLIQETRLLREFASKHSVLLQQSLSHGTGAVD